MITPVAALPTPWAVRWQARIPFIVAADKLARGLGTNPRPAAPPAPPPRVTAMAKEHGLDAGRSRRWWVARPGRLSSIPNPYTVGRHVVVPWDWTGADSQFPAHRTFGYAGCWIWTSENASSRTLGE